MSLQLYRNEAARQRLAAEGSSLQNVRERCERAAQAWDALAIRSERTDTARSQAAAEKLLTKLDENGDSEFVAPTSDDS